MVACINLYFNMSYAIQVCSSLLVNSILLYSVLLDDVTLYLSILLLSVILYCNSISLTVNY